jgi:hypothetical protein
MRRREALGILAAAPAALLARPPAKSETVEIPNPLQAQLAAIAKKAAQYLCQMPRYGTTPEGFNLLEIVRMPEFVDAKNLRFHHVCCTAIGEVMTDEHLALACLMRLADDVYPELHSVSDLCVGQWRRRGRERLYAEILRRPRAVAFSDLPLVSAGAGVMQAMGCYEGVKVRATLYWDPCSLSQVLSLDTRFAFR